MGRTREHGRRACLARSALSELVGALECKSANQVDRKSQGSVAQLRQSFDSLLIDRLKSIDELAHGHYVFNCAAFVDIDLI